MCVNRQLQRLAETSIRDEDDTCASGLAVYALGDGVVNGGMMISQVDLFIIPGDRFRRSGRSSAFDPPSGGRTRAHSFIPNRFAFPY